LAHGAPARVCDGPGRRRGQAAGAPTADRAKPAVPFGGDYRLVDFVLSNLVNGGYLKIVVLTQYKSHSPQSDIVV
jgi:ADP-glucose pyrophosphorylase